MIIHLGCLLPDTSVQPTRTVARKPACRSNLPLSLFGFAPGGVYHARSVTRPAVRSYRTLSPLPVEAFRRFAFCGTFPKVTLAGRYPAPCFRGARTFLSYAGFPCITAIIRPSTAQGCRTYHGLMQQGLAIWFCNVRICQIGNPETLA